MYWSNILTTSHRLFGCLALLVLAACSTTGPTELVIDRSIRAQGQDSRVQFVVLHYTSSNNATALKILSERNVSSHYLVTDEAQPKIYQLVDENQRAWHAGLSEWYGHTHLNASSIGIEIVNSGGSGTQWAPYSSAQIATVIALVRDVASRHQVKDRNIVGHSDIAPQRKVDPGPLFPWKTLADAGVGRWYDETLARQNQRAFEQSNLPDVTWIQEQLKRIGYTVPQHGSMDKATRNVLAAFQMHYRPSRYDGQADAETLGILSAIPSSP